MILPLFGTAGTKVVAPVTMNVAGASPELKAMIDALNNMAKMINNLLSTIKTLKVAIADYNSKGAIYKAAYKQKNDENVAKLAQAQKMLDSLALKQKDLLAKIKALQEKEKSTTSPPIKQPIPDDGGAGEYEYTPDMTDSDEGSNAALFAFLGLGVVGFFGVLFIIIAVLVIMYLIRRRRNK